MEKYIFKKCPSTETGMYWEGRLEWVKLSLSVTQDVEIYWKNKWIGLIIIHAGRDVFMVSKRYCARPETAWAIILNPVFGGQCHLIHASMSKISK